MTFEERMFGLNEDIDPRRIVKPRVRKLPDGRNFGSFIIHRGEKGFNPFKYNKIAREHGGTPWVNPSGDDEDTGLLFPVGGKEPSSVLKTGVKPVLDNIIATENPNDPEDVRRDEVLQIIDELLEQFNSLEGGERAYAKSIKGRLADLKAQLISITSAEEFKDVMRPILKFRSTQKKWYSLNNTILIWLQDPQATYVDSLGGWKKVGREPVPGAKIISINCVRSRPPKPGERKLIIHDFVAGKGKKDASELSQIEASELNRLLRKGVKLTNPVTGGNLYDLIHNFTDVRFTRNVSGEKDEFDEFMQGKENLDSLEWFDDSGEATEETMALVAAVEDVCRKHGITVTSASKEELHGARGMSSNGGTTITMTNGATQNEDYLKTLVHELTHSLCHWENAKFPLKDKYEIQEQEAELTAWMVLMMFGYESVTKTSMNYIGSWGLDEKNAVKVFNTMASVASYICNEINKRMGNTSGLNDGEPIGESLVGRMIGGIGRSLKAAAAFIKSKLSRGRITGRELAAAFGMESLYDRSAALENGRGAMSDEEIDDENMMGRLGDGYDPEGNDELPEYGLS